jgi:eukaryotic-like serine/threonine-protein kinase
MNEMDHIADSEAAPVKPEGQTYMELGVASPDKSQPSRVDADQAKDPDGYRFDSYEVRIRSGTLFRDGERVKIQDLPLRMLVVLLGRPGETVALEELGARLWGKDTFVDFTSGLRVAARKLREALGDSAAAPLFIKNVFGRGYQFIGQATPIYDPIAELDRGTDLDATDRPAIPPRLIVGLWLKLLFGAFIAIALFLAVGGFLYTRSHRPLASTNDLVVIGGVTNKTADQGLNGLLRPAFVIKFEESPYLDLIPKQRFAEKISNPDTAPLADELRGCAALHGLILLQGELLTKTPGYEIAINAWRCRDGRLLDIQRSYADSQGNILGALSMATMKMRSRLGESADSLQKYDVPAAQATTDSLAALKAFSSAEEKRRSGLVTESIPDYKIAIDLDPQFAIAHAGLASAYQGLAELELSGESARTAFNLRMHTTDRERLYITTHYYRYSTGDFPHEIEALELWHSTYPHDFDPVQNLAASYLAVGKPDRSLAMAQESVKLSPSGYAYASLLEAYLAMNNHQRAEDLCNDPAQINTDLYSFHLGCFVIFASKNDNPRAQRELEWARGKPWWPFFVSSEGDIALSQGQTSAAAGYFSEAVRSAQSSNNPELAALLSLGEASYEGIVGLHARSNDNALQGLSLAPKSMIIRSLVVLAQARAGDQQHARAEIEALRREHPQDTILNFMILPLAEASISLGQHDPRAAIAALDPARPYDDSTVPDISPAYYRGLAYLEDKQWANAKSQFQHILATGPAQITSLDAALATLQLGRTYQLSGDTKDASLAYSQVREFWKNAGPDFPPLMDLNRYQRELDAHL